VPWSLESLPALEEMLRLPNREVTPVEEEEEGLGLTGLFWLLPDPHRSKRVLAVAGYYAALAGQSPGESCK
jgi:hypothetical protein